MLSTDCIKNLVSLKRISMPLSKNFCKLCRTHETFIIERRTADGNQNCTRQIFTGNLSRPCMDCPWTEPSLSCLSSQCWCWTIYKEFSFRRSSLKRSISCKQPFSHCISVNEYNRIINCINNLLKKIKHRYLYNFKIIKINCIIQNN